MPSTTSQIATSNAHLMRELARMEAPISVTGIAFMPDGRILASGHLDNTVRLWNISDGSLEKTVAGPRISKVHVAFSPDGDTVASCVGDGATYELRIWSLRDGTLRATPEVRFCGVVAFAPAPNSLVLAVGTDAGTVEVWDIARMQRVRLLEPHISYINSLVFSSDGQLL